MKTFGVVCGVLAGALSNASPFAWTDWTTETANTAVSGTITLGSGSIGVGYSGGYSFTQLSGGTAYWDTSPATYTSATISNGPTGSDIIALNDATTVTHTITFSQSVQRVAMAVLSMGQGGGPVTYTFDRDFTIENVGPGYWGTGTLTKSGFSLTGVEGHGVILFDSGSTGISSISWTQTNPEFWHGFTVGVDAVVPEPSSMLALSLGLVALRRRRRNR